jgi:N4-gp56 family major capsid protein
MTNFAVIDVGQKVVAKELIDTLKQNLVFYKLGKMQKVNKGTNSKTAIFRGFAKQSLATTALTEGTVPTGHDLSMSYVRVTLAQYGDFTKISDLAEFLYDRSMVKDASEVLGIQAQETIDNLIMGTVAAGTNVVYGDGSVAARASVLSTMTLTTTLVRRAVRFLERGNVKKFTSPVGLINKAYALVAHPDTLNDLRADTDFVNAVNYSSPDPSNPNRGDLFTGEVGYWMGARIVSSTAAPLWAAAGGGSPAATVYGVLVFGEGAYAVSELEGGLETYIHTGGVQDTSNPLEQYSTVGWKWVGASAILDNNRLVRLEVGATLSGSSV